MALFVLCMIEKRTEVRSSWVAFSLPFKKKKTVVGSRPYHFLLAPVTVYLDCPLSYGWFVNEKDKSRDHWSLHHMTQVGPCSGSQTQTRFNLI